MEIVNERGNCPKCGKEWGKCQMYKLIQGHFFPKKKGRPAKAVAVTENPVK